MKTTKFSSKDQVIVPKAFRSSYSRQLGLEPLAMDTGEGMLLKTASPFASAELSEIAGMFANKVVPKTNADIQAALAGDAKKKWRDRR